MNCLKHPRAFVKVQLCVGPPRHWLVHPRAAAGVTHGTELLRLWLWAASELWEATYSAYFTHKWWNMHCRWLHQILTDILMLKVQFIDNALWHDKP